MNDSWLEGEEMTAVFEFLHRRIDVSELDDYNRRLNRDLELEQSFPEDNNVDEGVSGNHDSNYFNSEFPHQRIAFIELDDLGLVQLFQEDNDAVNGSTDTDDDGDVNYEEFQRRLFEEFDDDWW